MTAEKPAFHVQMRITLKGDRVRLARERERSAREHYAKPSVEKASAEVPGLVMVRNGRGFTFTYRGCSVCYFLRYGERAAVLTGTSHPMGYSDFITAPVQRHIDATLAHYWDLFAKGEPGAQEAV